jgi:putative ABC transport system substrate-binding protein
MKRRQFIAGLGSAAAWPVAARAQPRLLPIVGWLHAFSQESQRTFMPAFYLGLAETGYAEGRNIAVEHVWASDQFERRPALVADLVRRQVAVIVTDATGIAQIAKAATQTIPIVFLAGGDPVEFGLVASFNRPGGNLTGVFSMGPDLTAKRLEVLHKLVPGASIALLLGSTVPQYAEAEVKDLQSAARALGVPVAVYSVASEGEIAPAFATAVAQRAGALLMSANVLFQNARDQVISLAAQYAIPTMFADSESVAAGGLLSYCTDSADMYHQSGLYVGRILKGERPADLPIVQSTKFEFAINLQTAKRLGLTVPPTLIAIADKVIE